MRPFAPALSEVSERNSGHRAAAIKLTS